MYYYSTAHSSEAAYILGGARTRKLVAEFKNDQWRRLDDLNKGRQLASSITVGDKTMIVGGWSTE